MIKKTDLIQVINDVFKGVKLEDGIGLWEGQGLDDYATKEDCLKFRKRDEKQDWRKIPLIDLYKGSSSLSFFDAKGMQFHLTQFLLFDLDVFEKEEDELRRNNKLEALICPEVLFHLTHDLRSRYSTQRFLALHKTQVQCIIDYLSYKIQEREQYHLKFGFTYCSKEKSEVFYKEIESAISIWKSKVIL